jgi:hypothetical protein
VARVKVPPTPAFDIIQTLNADMTRYEEVFDEIRRPEPTPGKGSLPSEAIARGRDRGRAIAVVLSDGLVYPRPDVPVLSTVRTTRERS